MMIILHRNRPTGVEAFAISTDKIVMVTSAAKGSYVIVDKGRGDPKSMPAIENFGEVIEALDRAGVRSSYARVATPAKVDATVALTDKEAGGILVQIDPMRVASFSPVPDGGTLLVRDDGFSLHLSETCDLVSKVLFEAAIRAAKGYQKQASTLPIKE